MRRRELVAALGMALILPLAARAQQTEAIRRVSVFLTGDLPVQAPNKYELVVNLKAAKAMAFDLPAALVSRADEVIE